MIRRLDPSVRSLAAGGAYFAAVFAVGFILGALRVLVTAPRLGETSAVLLELPVILAASWVVARACVVRFAVPPGGARLAMGAWAFALLIAAELVLSVTLFGNTVRGHFAAYGQAPGLIGLAGQAAFALIPYAQGRAARTG